ncbi:MAG TPA: bifunctional tRNA (5-methylaminomethyl-2-thiouridine)(34)-methyltransferase MnmD/FAD-dependent 5-carboxymethylaminomethyl-2-thiouridine(34) oxidoreductase MnmC [Thiobacillaceae bacterium]|nr:bifunctional tRNA (5-methylaminomethyl-2-thiouridine)(34)-methyltransferase MnmD/FAD-dependent 5-carboxymethylaminomethyl-2-thiouridine(34) oxidoreductase MnmC [Thiobacillaceae bacterium]
MPGPALQPARLAFAADGVPWSEDYGDVYHAADGGPGQARHVFLAGNGLPGRWTGRTRFVILENGFGTGLNFLATWAAWQADPGRPDRLHYLAVEKHPFGRDDLAHLHAAWPEFQPLAEALRQDWPVPTPGFHRLAFAGCRVVLTLMFGESETCLARLRATVDAFYLDGFDPRKNPDMWSASLFRRCARLAAPDATLATWCVAGAVRDALAEAGFATGKRPGFARKRHMLTGGLAATHAPSPAPPSPAHGERRAVVLGAGLAGSAIAWRLAVRGWQVDVLERHEAPAREASGNLAGIVRPLLSRDDNIASRLNRACFLHTARSFVQLDRAGHPPRRCFNGLLQMARDPDHEALQRALAARFPSEFVLFLDQAQAGLRLGHATSLGGWWFPDAGWAHPPGVCRSMLAASGGGSRFQGRVSVAGTEHRDGQWHLLDAAGLPLARAPVLILANGTGARRLAPHLPLTPVRGQVSHVAAGRLPALEHALCREGYLTPAVDGIHCLGASYAWDEGTELRTEEHAGNLVRLAHMLPGAEADLDPASLDGRVGFRAATPDRLPLVGALPDPASVLARDCRLADLPRLPGLYGLLGLGSRGLVWASLAAETLASRLDGDPPPLEGDLIDALDPGRFRLRAHRRGRG